jgi:hypothetical protein
LELCFSHSGSIPLSGDINPLVPLTAPKLDLLNPHVTYIINYIDAYETLLKFSKHENFANFLKVTNFNSFTTIQGRMNLPELKHQDLQDFLILPVQRLPRYVILIENLLRHTKQTHPGTPFCLNFDDFRLPKFEERVEQIARVYE